MSAIEKLTQAKSDGNIKETLSSLIQITSQSTGKTEAMIVNELAEAASINKTTVTAIIKGKIKNPPQKRLDAFATVLTDGQSATS